MRELDRHAAKPPNEHFASASRVRSVAVVGNGRLGGGLASALSLAGFEVRGPVGRGAPPPADAVLLCVPDAEIAAAATAAAGAAALVGHTSGATPLSALSGPPGSEHFALHPLQTFTGEETPKLAAERLRGAGCAVAGSSQAATEAAREVAERLGMVPFEVADADRPTYHAAASMASNFLVTLEDAAETVAAGAGLAPEAARSALAPLVRATVENWVAAGPRRALTGPVARGDERTVASQRQAVRDTAPQLLALFDAMVERTRALAGPRAGATPVEPGTRTGTAA